MRKRESVEQLRADIRQLEEANQRLAARTAEKSGTGERLRSFVGEGNRQYLTGIRMGGNRVLILLDASASMLGRTYVNVVRFRSMPEARRKRGAEMEAGDEDRGLADLADVARHEVPDLHLQRAGAQRRGRHRRQVAGRARTARSSRPPIASLRKIVPDKGTSLINAFNVIKTLDPQPDNVFLITDGLPTQGDKPPSAPEDVKPERRVKYMVDAVRSVPRRLPVNVLLFPMDGDPQAPGYFWEFAVASGGSLITPSRDWP